MKTQHNSLSSRRNFLKKGALAGGSLVFLSSKVDGLAAEPSEAPSNDTLKTIHSLCTTHGNFQDKPIPDADLQAVLQASVRAASASNNQSYSIIVIRDRKMMKSLCGYQGACTLLYCADYARMKASAESLGLRYDPSTIVDLVTAGINTMLAAQTAVIAARSLGIDSLLTNGVHRGNMERHWKLLGLPPTHCFPMIALVLGYATQKPDHRKGRLEGLGVIHEEKYHPLTKDEVETITSLYDDKKRNISLNGDWDTQGFKHYLEWYFKAWVGVDKPRKAEETQMFRLLKRCGFIDLQKG